MMESLRERSASEVLKRGYSQEELSHLYELGRFFLENGNVKQAEIILNGVSEIMPDFVPALLARVAISITNKEYELALKFARDAAAIDPGSPVCALYLITCLLITRDFNAAGTLLGEVGEKVESGAVSDPNVIRFYKGQLARYQTRG